VGVRREEVGSTYRDCVVGGDQESLYTKVFLITSSGSCIGGRAAVTSEGGVACGDVRK
jgi:hypothetical protein